MKLSDLRIPDDVIDDLDDFCDVSFEEMYGATREQLMEERGTAVFKGSDKDHPIVGDGTFEAVEAELALRKLDGVLDPKDISILRKRIESLGYKEIIKMIVADRSKKQEIKTKREKKVSQKEEYQEYANEYWKQKKYKNCYASDVAKWIIKKYGIKKSETTVRKAIKNPNK